MNPIPTESFYNQYGVVEGGGKYRKRISSSYSRQIDAYYAYDSLPPRDRAQAKVFSYETSSTGKRQFLLSDITTFYEEFSIVDERHRHVYELIRDSFPCRLYFDLEFNQPANPSVQGQELTMKWIDLVLWKIYQHYNISVGRGDVMVLDSSTEEKFSKHLHLLLFNHEERNHHCEGEEEKEKVDWTHSISRPHQEYLFENNIEVGQFVQSILWDITRPMTTTATTEGENDLAVILLDGQYRLPKEEYQCFWVNPSKEEVKESENVVKDGHHHHDHHASRRERKVCFVDLGVYTRNRAFRLFNCCKYGKTRRLSINREDMKHFTMLREVGKDRYPIRRVFAWTFIVPADLFIADSCDGKTSSITSRSDSNGQASEPMGHGDGNGHGDEGNTAPATFASFASFFNRDRYSLLPALPKDRANGIHSLSRAANFGHNPLHFQQLDGGYNNGSGQHTWKDREVARSHYPRQSSLFPKLDAYIQHTFGERGGVVGYISSWTLFFRSHGQFPFYVLRYQIGKNRYCEHVQRPHKSNGVYFDVNLMAGEVQQGCWDVDCKGFNFPTFHLPLEIWPHNAEEVKSAIQNTYHHSISS